MIVLEMKAVVKPSQCTAIDDAIRTVQFILSINIVRFLPNSLSLRMTLTLQLDKHRPNELGQLLLVSMTIVRKK